jgi:hypothetical protein
MNGRITRYLWHFPFTPFDWLRTGFDKLRANGKLNQSFPNSHLLSLRMTALIYKAEQNRFEIYLDLTISYQK